MSGSFQSHDNDPLMWPQGNYWLDYWLYLGTLTIQFRFVRQRSQPTLEQTNKQTNRITKQLSKSNSVHWVASGSFQSHDNDPLLWPQSNYWLDPGNYDNTVWIREAKEQTYPWTNKPTKKITKQFSKSNNVHWVASGSFQSHDNDPLMWPQGNYWLDFFSYIEAKY